MSKQEAKKYLFRYIFVFLAFWILLICSFLYWQQIEKAKTEAENKASQQLKNLSSTLDMYGKKRSQLVNNYLNNVKKILNQRGEIEEHKENILQIEIKNQITQEVINEEVPQITIGNEQLQYNLGLFDEVLAKTTCPMALYQKVDKGYIRVGVTQNELVNAVVGYYFIPNNSEVVPNLDAGGLVTTKTIVGGKEFLAIHQPILIENKVKAAFVLSVREDYLTILKNQITPLKAPENSFLYVVNKEGIVIYHPQNVGLNMRMAEPIFWKYLKQNTSKFMSSPQPYFLVGKYKSSWQYIFYDKNTENYWIIQTDNSQLPAILAWQYAQVALVMLVVAFVGSWLLVWLLSRRLNFHQD